MRDRLAGGKNPGFRFRSIRATSAVSAGVDGSATMGERTRGMEQQARAGMRKKRALAIAAAAAGLIVLGLPTGDDARAQTAGAERDAALAARAQAQTRPRTRIRVTPGYPYRTTPTDYPTPYPIEFPGPGYVRECKSWLVQEFRPSGTVIVPKMSCWWVRG
jgi:hypothetical protein